MKKFAKLCTVLYFVLVVVFGIFFGMYLMKQMGDDDNIAGQILYSLGGMVICAIFSFFIVMKIVGIFTKSGVVADVTVFIVQLVLTVAVVFLALNSGWRMNSIDGSSNSGNGSGQSSSQAGSADDHDDSESHYLCYVCNKTGASYKLGSYYYCYDCYVTAKAWHDTVY